MGNKKFTFHHAKEWFNKVRFVKKDQPFKGVFVLENNSPSTKSIDKYYAILRNSLSHDERVYSDKITRYVDENQRETISHELNT